MPFHFRPRWPGARTAGTVALTVALALLFTACAQNHPDSIFHKRTDFNREVDVLFKILIWAGVAVFIFVEAVLVIALIRFRQRPGMPEPEHVHGNTTLEIAWTVIPAIVLIVIAIPTVRTIFTTQAKAAPNALLVEVIGHQWWWEFRYPQFAAPGANGRMDTLVTANELYLPVGRTVNFKLNTADVIHSFWVPSLGGKRDLIGRPGSMRTNYIWFTPDSVGSEAFNGACVEYCGTSHANMRFKAFTVSAADFDSWVAHQRSPAAGAPVLTPAANVQPPAAGTAVATAVNAQAAAQRQAATTGAPPAPAPGAQPAAPRADSAAAPAVTQAGFIAYPREKIPAYAVPQTPLPADLAFDDNLRGDAANGAKLVAGAGTCLACHSMRGVPNMVGIIGPNLTHIASRSTIAAGLYPNDARHLARWIKNAPRMKPGIFMPALGTGEIDPRTKAKGALTDQQIADIVAYLQTLK
jgi:cytochrome c oxidase subunit 2